MKPKTVGRVFEGQQASQYAQHLCHGFPVGLPILTADGALPAEYLTPGDRIVTRNGGLVPVQEITAHTHVVRAIKFTAGCLGRQGPEADVVLPADQPVLVREWRARAMFGQSQAMATAVDMVDHEFITDIGPRRMVLFRLQFDQPRVVYSDGIELGTAPLISVRQAAVA